MSRFPRTPEARRLRRTGMTLLGLALAPGLATAADPQPETAIDPALVERVDAFWKARQAGSPEALSFYPTPELGGPLNRSRIAEGRLGYSGYEVVEIERSDDTASVELRVQPRVPGGPRATARPEGKKRWFTVVETWNKICGTWYRKPQPVGFSKHEFTADQLGPAPDCDAIAAKAAEEERLAEAQAPQESR